MKDWIALKKFINIWSSRGLSIYGKITIIKSFLIPKFVYICALLPTPNELLKQLNQLLFKFLSKGTDKVRRVSVINEYEEVKSLRLAWLKRIFNENDGTWKRYLKHQLKPFGGLFFINCNYDVNDYTISSQFYRELLLWWSQFRGMFASDSNWQRIIWNNKEIQIDKKPVCFKNYYESGIVYVSDLLFHLSSKTLSAILQKKTKKKNSKVNILQ